MVPVDMVFVQELAGQAMECLARALPDASASQRELLLAAMNALDDIEALVSTGFEVTAELVGSAGGEIMQPLRAMPSAELARFG